MIKLELLDNATFKISGLATELFCCGKFLTNGIYTISFEPKRLLLALLHKDDVKLYLNNTEVATLYKKDFEYTLTEDEIKEFKIEPFAHQIAAINFGLKHPKWLNLFSMGLG